MRTFTGILTADEVAAFGNASTADKEIEKLIATNVRQAKEKAIRTTTDILVKLPAASLAVVKAAADVEAAKLPK